MCLQFELDACDTSQGCKTGSCQAVGCYQPNHKGKLAISCTCIGTNHQAACLSLFQLCCRFSCYEKTRHRTGCEVYTLAACVSSRWMVVLDCTECKLCLSCSWLMLSLSTHHAVSDEQQVNLLNRANSFVYAGVELMHTAQCGARGKAE